MKILLTALNAKYIHSSLAIRSLQKYTEGLPGGEIVLAEYTINHDEAFILRQIFKEKPEVVCFSCYIWNIAMIRRLADQLKKLLPDSLIVLGGPEVSFDAEDVLKETPSADMIICGEGEAPFYGIVKELFSGGRNFEHIKGIVYRQNGQLVSTGTSWLVPLDDIPFVYDDLAGLENRIVYYETQRGCPYNCQYCLSSIEKGVRFLSMERVKKDLQIFLDHKVKQVKFVDRTFNCSRTHAKAIWEYLIQHDNGITNFHMEITADLMDDETIVYLSQARPGLFQFEIGVQTTNEETRNAISRNVSFEKLADVVKKIKQAGNIHQHLDLIAGLPKEGYISFGKSFDDVYTLEPEQFQLGFLKLLKGSGLRRDAERYGIVYRQDAPYEVLFTRDLPFEDVMRLKNIEEIVETYYNSGKAFAMLRLAVKLYGSPFWLYEALGREWEKRGFFAQQHSKMELFTILYEFVQQDPILQKQINPIKELLRFDIYRGDNIKTLPYWLEKEEPPEFIEWRKDFCRQADQISRYLPSLIGYSPRQIERMCHIEYFPYAIEQAQQGVILEEPTVILFDYQTRDAMFHQAAWYPLVMKT